MEYFGLQVLINYLSITFLYLLTKLIQLKRMRKDITQTFLNACDLYIESVKIETQGYFYIVWKRGKKITQTLKY